MRCGTLRKLDGERAELDGKVGIIKVSTGSVSFFPVGSSELGSKEQVILACCDTPNLADDYASMDERNLKLLDHPLRGVKEGDVVVGHADNEHTVLEVLVNSVLISGPYDPTWSFSWRTFESMEKDGYTPKGQEEEMTPPRIKMTMKEIAEKLGTTPDKLEIV